MLREGFGRGVVVEVDRLGLGGRHLWRRSGRHTEMYSNFSLLCD